MLFAWTPHRFSGGVLALDVANSVILRFDAARSIDRFAIAEQLDAFPDAAAQFCAERALFGPLRAPSPGEREAFLAMREAIDRYFRARVRMEETSGLLAALLETLAPVLRRSAAPDELGAATAHSALRLIPLPDDGRMKICSNCGWLFLDRSKNRSRAWCDMAVCGNRAKASRHYRRKRQEVSA